jgi:hypothetical protein
MIIKTAHCDRCERFRELCANGDLPQGWKSVVFTGEANLIYLCPECAQDWREFIQAKRKR